MSIRPTLIVMALLCSGILHAEVTQFRMPEIFTDHMVLQQEQPIAVWGWAAPGERVKVTIEATTQEAKGGADGRWDLTFPPLKAAQKQGKAVRFEVQAASQKIDYKDVVVGEVWLASGQSNMNRPVAKDEIEKADYPQIRMFTSNGSILRRNTLDNVIGWVGCTPATVATCGDIIKKETGERRAFSEVAYHFAKKLHVNLKVPVGIIHTSAGGTTARDWTPNPDIGTQYAFDVDHGDLRHKHGALYQVKLHAMVPYAIKGVVWYQGEDDGGNGKYAEDFKAMIDSWRQLWKQPELPFYFVQIAQTTYRGGMLGVWDAQAWVMDHVKNTGLVPSNDIYDNGPGNFKPGNVDNRTGWPIAGGGDPHPPHRPLMASRLTDVVLSEVYGRKLGEVFGPMYASHKITDGRVVVSFKHAGEGLSTNDGAEPNWFEISADGKEYVKAKAEISAVDAITLSAPEVAQPKFIRFAWHRLCRHNLINKKGLPAIPFQSKAP